MFEFGGLMVGALRLVVDYIVNTKLTLSLLLYSTEEELTERLSKAPSSTDADSKLTRSRSLVISRRSSRREDSDVSPRRGKYVSGFKVKEGIYILRENYEDYAYIVVRNMRREDSDLSPRRGKYVVECSAFIDKLIMNLLFRNSTGKSLQGNIKSDTGWMICLV